MKKPIYFFIAFLVVFFDQITKYLVRTFIGSSETIRVFPFLHLINIRNEGAAFGLFKGFGNITFIIISVIAVVFVLYLIIQNTAISSAHGGQQSAISSRTGLSLILGGAIGNLIDRVFFGKVTDFIDVFAGRFHWPAFNVADSALTVGLILMLLTVKHTTTSQETLFQK